MVTVSCVIPAYNEATTIGNVVNVVLHCPDIREVIVVNDGSSDKTQEILKEFSQIKTINLNRNSGKTYAVLTGVSEAKGKHLLLLDADLVGLTPKDISLLISPILSDENSMSLTSMPNAPGIFHMYSFLGINCVSGQRCLPKNYFSLLDPSSVKGYSLEIALNNIALEKDASIYSVHWPNVRHRKKREKFGLLRGELVDLEMTITLLGHFGLFNVLNQFLEMSRRKIERHG